MTIVNIVYLSFSHLFLIAIIFTLIIKNEQRCIGIFITTIMEIFLQ